LRGRRGLLPDSLVVSGTELATLDDAALAERLPRIAVVARATAADKMRIVKGLKARGDIAGMTGDGVNDAPALKSADIGVAMGKGGTDVAREASDMVLADDNFATIVAAVAEGRVIYANIRRFITFLFAANAGLVFAVTAASLLGWDQPMAPIQILWINLITNGLPALALGLEPSIEDRMNQPPRSPKESIVRMTDVARIAIVGLVMAAGGLWAYYEATGGAPRVANDAGRTAAFTIFALAPLIYAFAKRSDHLHCWQTGLLSNRMLLYAVVIGVGLQAIAVFVPGAEALFKTGEMSGADWLRVGIACILPFIAVEVIKLTPLAGRRPVALGTP
jgi:Ca2+-transporting ATPase